MPESNQVCDDKHCRHCDVLLIVDENWTASQAKFRNYRCKTCAKTATKKWMAANPEYLKEYREANREKIARGLKSWRERNPTYSREYLADYRKGVRRRKASAETA